MRGEKKSDKVVRTACEEVQTMDINTPVNPITLIHVTHNFSLLLSGTQNPWGSIQRRNCRFRPHATPQSPPRTYNSFRYPTYDSTYNSPQWRPPVGVGETERSPESEGAKSQKATRALNSKEDAEDCYKRQISIYGKTPRDPWHLLEARIP